MITFTNGSNCNNKTIRNERSWLNPATIRPHSTLWYDFQVGNVKKDPSWMCNCQRDRVGKVFCCSCSGDNSAKKRVSKHGHNNCHRQTNLWYDIAMGCTNLIQISIFSVLLFELRFFWIVARSVAIETGQRASTRTWKWTIQPNWFVVHDRWRCRGHNAVPIAISYSLGSATILNDNAEQSQHGPECEDYLRSITQGNVALRAHQQTVPVIAITELVQEPVNYTKVFHKIIGTEQRECTAIQTGCYYGATCNGRPKYE